MTKIKYSIFFFLLSGLLFISCGGSSSDDASTTKAGLDKLWRMATVTGEGAIREYPLSDGEKWWYHYLKVENDTLQEFYRVSITDPCMLKKDIPYEKNVFE